MAVLEIRLLGGLEIRCGNGVIGKRHDQRRETGNLLA